MMMVVAFMRGRPARAAGRRLRIAIQLGEIALRLAQIAGAERLPQSREILLHRVIGLPSR